MGGLAKCLSLLLVACLFCGSIGDHEKDGSSALSDVPQPPLDCDSPGWRQTPQDAVVNPGQYVFMKCRSMIPHTHVYWMVDGMEDIMGTPFSARTILFGKNHSMRFGPLVEGEDPVMIGCHAKTIDHGLLPSPLATISVLSPPQYKAPTFAVGVEGRPFDVDMGYSSSVPPSSFIWMKNGLAFEGDGDRVKVEYDRLVFSEVQLSDYGRYEVRARNRAGEGSAAIVVKVVAWPANSTANLTDLSPHLALLLALYQQSNITDEPLPPSHPSVDRLGVMAVIRRLLFHATPEAQQQGAARMLLEELLERLRSMSSSFDDLLDSDLETLNRITNCTSAIPRYDCTTFEVLKYRTYDGTCNNLFYPLAGAALTPFPRLLPAEYEDGVATPVGHEQAVNGSHASPPWPSARIVSWKVVRNSSLTKPPVTAGITHMVMQWGQFLDHDVDLSPVFNADCGGCTYTRQCSPIHVNTDDDTFGDGSTNAAQCLGFSRSIPACLVDRVRGLARNQINQVTSYIDASQVYGSSRELALSLRSRAGGLLKQGGRAESDKGNLPFQKERPEIGLLPFFIAGDERANEQTGLTVMHTLWLREHNRIARSLAEMNPCWDDEKLYQAARKIVGAQMQKITYKDFLPTLFGSYLHTYVPLYTKYNPFVDASIPNAFAAAAYRFGHSLIRDQLLRLDENYTKAEIGHLDLSHAFFNPVSYFEGYGTDRITRGLMVDMANPVDEFLNPVLTSKLFPKRPGGPGGDLASLNIQRGRDHGIPSYRAWQHFCEERFPGHSVGFADNGTVETLRHLYGEEGFRHGIDLWVGGLSEERLEGAQIGPTFACILGLTFSRLRDGDRFWYESEHQFSPVQRRSLLQSSLGRVACDNGDNIKRVPRDVFTSGSQLMPCEELPAVDLQLWRDFSCRQRPRQLNSNSG